MSKTTYQYFLAEIVKITDLDFSKNYFYEINHGFFSEIIYKKGDTLSYKSSDELLYFEVEDILYREYEKMDLNIVLFGKMYTGSQYDIAFRKKHPEIDYIF